MDAIIIWWMSVRPRAKWLIVTATIYWLATFIVYLFTRKADHLMTMQMVWVFVAAIPLWHPRLAKWLDMRPLLLDWFKRKLNK